MKSGAFLYRNRKGILFGLAILALFALRVWYVLGQEASETLPNLIGQKEIIVGSIAADPDLRDTDTRVVLGDLSIDNVPITGKVLVSLSPDSDVSYGDEIQVAGKVNAPQAFQTDSGHTFDYPNYLRAQGVSAQMSYAKLIAKKSADFSIFGLLFSLKHAFEHSLDRLFPNPDNALLQGVLLGEKHGISQQITDAFIASGLVHLVVLSGYNISIIALAIFWLLAPLPRRWSFSLGGVMMILFALMTGAGAATIRALAMGLIALLANYLRRPADALRALALAAGAMIFWNPLVPLFDTSFILSVLATFGLITLSPWVEHYLLKIRFLRKPYMEGTRGILASTLAVEAFVVPALLYFSGVLSLLSLPANALVLPIIPATMLFGFIAGALGLISPYLGLLPALVADLLLKFVLLVVAVVASLPFSSVTIAQFSPWFLVVAYLPLTWFAISRYKISLASSSRGR